EYEEAGLDATDEVAERLHVAAHLPQDGATGEPLDPAEERAAFYAAMDDDLDTPAAIAALRRLGERILLAREAHRPTGEAQAQLRPLGGILRLPFADRRGE